MDTSGRDLFAQAIQALQRGDTVKAELHFKNFLHSQPEHLGALNLLGVVLTQHEKYAEAESYIRRAIEIDANSDTTFYNYGIVLKNLGRGEDALTAFDRALALKPSIPESWNHRGTVLNDLRRYDEAAFSFERAVGLRPNFAEALSNLGKSLFFLGRFDETCRVYHKAISLAPALGDAWVGYALALVALNRCDEASVAAKKAIELRPNSAEAWMARARASFFLNRMPEALEAHDRAIDLNPNLKYLPGERLHTKQMLCDWSDYQSECLRILDGVRKGSPIIVPFSFLSVAASPADQLLCARFYVEREINAAIKPLWNGEKYLHERIRVAYLSPDFRGHPTSYLMAGLFESHDRSRFETIAISFVRKDDPMQRRLHSAFDRFVDVSELSDGTVAAILREAEVDIAVDLAGFTKGNRAKILASRPAPIQVSYLGYPGSMGAEFIDYLIADEILIPDDHASFYSEAIVRMPHTYQATDDKRVISAARVSRREAGLPEDSFVFCSFNNSYKINPEIFDIWMRLLRRVENSVLWLIEINPVGMDNLRGEARKRGISPERIIFAPRVEQGEHLARHRLADLFLDTLPYNSHTTASDALWAGLPIVTCLGSTFAGRVAASILKAIGLPELVTESLASYEALALKLAEEPNLLQQIRAKLADNRQTQPLFNTRSFAADLEQAYLEIWRRSQAGHPPRSFRVRRDPQTTSRP